MVNQKCPIGLIIIAILMSACAPMSVEQSSSGRQTAEIAQQDSSCPAPGTVVPLKKVMNPSFIADYQGCDIVVESTFLKMGNAGYKLGDYNTSANTTFQVVEPGGASMNLGGMSFGTYAGVPKAKSDILFDLKQGEPILLRGAPIGYYGGSVAVFHATRVTRK